MGRARRLIPLTLLWLTGCNTQKQPAPAPTPSPPGAKEASGPRFVDVGSSAGINYRWEIAGTRPLTILQTIGNGCALLDYDGDGNLDILLVGPKPALFKGDGKGRFADVTVETGLSKLSGNLLGCAVGDYDNDGFPDVYITAYRGGLLLHNEGGKSFRDVTVQAGIPPQRWGSSAAFTDVDGDGRLDLYIANYAQFDKTKPQLCDFNGILSSCGPRYYQPEFGTLYRNEGGRFRDVTRAWSAHTVSGRALGVAVADYNGSGRQSFAITNDELPGDLLMNTGKTFRNVGTESGTALDNDGHPHGGMGIDWGDYDNDLRLDLFVATFVHEAKSVYHNEDGATFVDRSAALGVAESTLPYIAFGCKWLDADNDGWLDLLIANGHVQDNIAQIEKGAAYRQPTQLFLNRQGAALEEVSAQAGEPFQRPIVGRGLAVGDYDNDGRVDALVVDAEGTPMLLHNETPAAGHWLSVRLEGVKSNRDGAGALLTVQADGKKQLRKCGTDGSYMSASDRRVHVGLGSAQTATITVKWPRGGSSVYKDVPANRTVTLREGESRWR